MCLDPAEMRAAQAVLSEANDTHGTRFQLDRRFDNGFQSGAWRLTDDSGRGAVLKWSSDRAWAPQIARAAGPVAKIRAAGYPTPEWLAVGTTASGFGYQIQEFVPGRNPSQVGAHEARLLIGVLEMHAGLDPDPQRCWSEYVTRMSAQRADLNREVAQTGPMGRRLVQVCEQLIAGHAVHGPVALPTGDLVHGDFRPGNILFGAERISGVIDIEALGSGTRAFDYATLLTGGSLTPEAVHLLCAAGEQVAGPGVLAHCFAHVLLDLAAFVYRRELQPGIQNLGRLVERAVILLER